MKSNYKRRLIIGLLVMMLIPMLVFGGYAAFVLRDLLRRTTIERLATSAAYRRNDLENWIERLTGTLYTRIATIPNMAQALVDNQVNRLNPTLDSHLSDALADGFIEIMIVSADGKLQYSTDAARQLAPERTCPPKIVCASQLLQEENRPVRLVVEYPILDAERGQQVGSVVGLASTDQLDSILSNRAGLGEGGTSYLVSVNGTVHWLPGYGTKYTGKPNVSRLDQSIQVVDAGTYRGLSTGEVFGVTAFIPRLFAWVVVESPASELFPASEAVLVLTLITFWIMVYLIYLLSRWISQAIDGNMKGLTIEARDLKVQLGKVTEAEQRRSRAIADMGHELRTPINSILNFSGFLNDGLFGSLTSDQADMVKQIHSSSQHLLELINDLVDMSQIEAGQMKLFVQEYDPAPLFDQALGTLHSLILEKPIQIVTDLPRQWPTMRGDKRRVLQILLNLVSNAAKFTEKGTITLRAHTYATRLEVRIEDTGPGVDPALVPHLFEPFQTGNTARSQEKGGTGLGLSLSRFFARMHGGDLTYQSDQAAGAVFILTLPLDAIEQAE
jgi:signal transduction histidine kinase